MKYKMKYKTFFLVLAVIFLVTLSGCKKSVDTTLEDDIQDTTEEQRQEIMNDIAQMFACSVDSDCIIVKAGCCDCNHGGRNIALNKASETVWLSQLDINCQNQACLTVISNDASCSSGILASCENQVCKI